MTRRVGDDPIELMLRDVLRERAEEVAGRARSVAEMTAVLAPRLQSADRPAPIWVAVLRLALTALILLAILAAAAALFGSRPPRPMLRLAIAVDMPLEGEPGAPAVVAAVRLAIGRAPVFANVSVELAADGVFDDARDGVPNADQGAANMERIAGDPRYVAVIGPYNSFVARAELPIANQAGILICSPSNTAPGLTQGADPSLRPRPDRPTYVRVATTDDGEARAAAQLLYGTLATRSVFVVSTVEPWAGGRSNVFVAAFEQLGGTVVGRGSIGAGGDPPAAVARMIAASHADGVFFDGPAPDGAAVLAALAPTSAIPFVGLDTILDGPRSAAGSFLSVAGSSSINAYGVLPTGADPALGPEVASAYAAAVGHTPESYVLAGDACASIILDAVARLDTGRLTSLPDWREAVRAEVTTPGRTYRTATGTIGFDANGDAQPGRVSVYRADSTGGDWTFSELLELPPGT